MTPYKVNMGVGISSLIQHIRWAPNLKRRWLDYVKKTPEKMNDSSSGQGKEKNYRKNREEKKKKKKYDDDKVLFYL